MKYIALYLWHGEDLGWRLILGASAVSLALSQSGKPVGVEGWAAIVGIFLTAVISKSAKKETP